MNIRAKVDEYNKCMIELNTAIDLFTKYKIPKVGSKLLKKLEKQIAKQLDVSISNAYYSENIEGYNVDLVIKLSYENYYNVFVDNTTPSWYRETEKDKVIKSIDVLTKKAFSAFMAELDD